MAVAASIISILSWGSANTQTYGRRTAAGSLGSVACESPLNCAMNLLADKLAALCYAIIENTRHALLATGF